jgi:hypothetical protein
MDVTGTYMRIYACLCADADGNWLVFCSTRGVSTDILCSSLRRVVRAGIISPRRKRKALHVRQNEDKTKHQLIRRRVHYVYVKKKKRPCNRKNSRENVGEYKSLKTSGGDGIYLYINVCVYHARKKYPLRLAATHRVQLRFVLSAAARAIIMYLYLQIRFSHRFFTIRSSSSYTVPLCITYTRSDRRVCARASTFFLSRTTACACASGAP